MASEQNTNQTSKKKCVEVEISAEVHETLLRMEAYKKIPVNTMIDTALKRFIATHKDYLPDSGLS